MWIYGWMKIFLGRVCQLTNKTWRAHHRVSSVMWVGVRLHHGARYTCYSNWKIAINYNKPWGLCYFNKLHFYPHRHRFTRTYSRFSASSFRLYQVKDSTVDCGDETEPWNNNYFSWNDSSTCIYESFVRDHLLNLSPYTHSNGPNQTAASLGHSHQFHCSSNDRQLLTNAQCSSNFRITYLRAKKMAENLTENATLSAACEFFTVWLSFVWLHFWWRNEKKRDQITIMACLLSVFDFLLSSTLKRREISSETVFFFDRSDLSVAFINRELASIYPLTVSPEVIVFVPNCVSMEWPVLVAKWLNSLHKTFERQRSRKSVCNEKYWQFYSVGVTFAHSVQLRVVRMRNVARFHARDIIFISAAYAITLHCLFRHRQMSAIAMRDLLPLAALEKDI